MASQTSWIMIAGIAAMSCAITSCGNNNNPTQMGAQTNGKTIWKLFKPQSDRFEVLLPSIPQHVAEAHHSGNEVTKYDVYLSQDREGNVYMISLTQYPASYQMGSAEEVLEAVKNGALGSNTKNELQSAETSTYLNLPSMDFSIRNNDSAIRSKAIVDGKTLIVLTVMNRDASHIDSDFNTFAGSFVLKSSNS